MIYNTFSTELDNMLKPPDDLAPVYRKIEGLTRKAGKNEVNREKTCVLMLMLMVVCAKGRSGSTFKWNVVHIRSDNSQDGQA